MDLFFAIFLILNSMKASIISKYISKNYNFILQLHNWKWYEIDKNRNVPAKNVLIKEGIVIAFAKPRIFTHIHWSSSHYPITFSVLFLKLLIPPIILCYYFCVILLRISIKVSWVKHHKLVKLEQWNSFLGISSGGWPVIKE